MEQTDATNEAEAALRELEGHRFGEAESRAQKALAADANNPLALKVLGSVRTREGRFEDAIEYFKGAWAIARGDAELPYMIGAASARAGNLKAALTHFQSAADLEPDNPVIWLNIGKAALTLRRWSHAKTAFEYCRKLDPENLEATAGLARLELRNDEPARALGMAEEVVGRDPDNLLARHVVADASYRLGDFQRALDEARAIYKHAGVSNEIRRTAMHLAADAADALGEYDMAFALYAATNTLTAEFYSDKISSIKTKFETEKMAELARVTPEVFARAACWPKPTGGTGPIFFLGFTRSGMSMLDNVLSRHPLIVSGKKRPNAQSWMNILWAKDTPAQMMALTPQDIQTLRDDYWQMIADGGIEAAEGSRVYEFMPFFSRHLALFALVFPDAKYIFAHRDPRDVVLSCFRHRFSPTRAMYEFLDLKDAAHYYQGAMAATWATRHSTALDIIDVGYNELVNDLDGTARRVIDFLELPWREDIFPGSDQGADGPATARENWRHYEAHLAPVREILDVWATRFGYD